MQTKKLTAIEVATNTFTGLLGSWLISLYFISHSVSAIETATIITIACTIWSIARGYFIRRFFNRISHRFTH